MIQVCPFLDYGLVARLIHVGFATLLLLLNIIDFKPLNMSNTWYMLTQTGVCVSKPANSVNF